MKKVIDDSHKIGDTTDRHTASTSPVRHRRGGFCTFWGNDGDST